MTTLAQKQIDLTYDKLIGTAEKATGYNLDSLLRNPKRDALDTAMSQSKATYDQNGINVTEIDRATAIGNDQLQSDTEGKFGMQFAGTAGTGGPEREAIGTPMNFSFNQPQGSYIGAGSAGVSGNFMGASPQLAAPKTMDLQSALMSKRVQNIF